MLGAAGFDPAVGVTELDYEVAAFHRLMMERSRHVMVLADHSKLGFRAPAVVAPLQMVSTLITDDDAPEDMLVQLRSCGLQVSLVRSQRQSMSLARD
jgi:DeoR/GlpR family transcriptional regulator of sugar metabolism